MAWKDLLNKSKEMAMKGAATVKSGALDAKDKLSQSHAEKKAAAAPLDGAIIRYAVVYLGGLAKYPKKLTGEIGMNIMPDRFYFRPLPTTKMEEDFEIPYSAVERFELKRHQITNTEMMLSNSGDLKSLEQENNIEITYREDGKKIVLRLEMLTGITLYGQAGKCREMMDILRQHDILDKLQKDTQQPAPSAAVSAADELKKYKELLDMGILTQEEFDAKKKQLLGL